MADQAAVYDASGLNAPPDLLMKLSNGVVKTLAERRPEWFEHLYDEFVAGKG